MKISAKLLGIDIGTSGLKVCVFDQNGNLLAGAYRASDYLPLPAGQAEQSAEQWWRNLCSAIKEVLTRPNISTKDIKGIGVCGFHHCPIFLKEDGQSARPVMLLHDERLPQSRDELKQTEVLGKMEKLTKSMISAGHFPPIFYYIAQNDPAGLARTRWIVLAKDYLRFKLTGNIGAEICDATGLNLIKAGQSKWSQQLCEILSVPKEVLPSIASPADIAGAVTKSAATRTGLRAGTPVVYGGGDSHCALLGLGCIENSHTGLLLGTNSTLRTVFNKFIYHPQLKLWGQHHVVPGHYTISASSMAGASVLNWFKKNFFAGRMADNIEQTAGNVPVGSAGLMFLPYIYGERCPFYNPQASGAFTGIKYWHKTEHFLRSIIEAVALNIANCLDLITQCADSNNTVIDHLRLGGGGSKMTLWHQVISDCLNKPVRIMNTREAGTLGAALLAGIGTGLYANYSEAVEAAVRVQRVMEPNRNNHMIYRQLKDKLNDLYRRIQ